MPSIIITSKESGQIIAESASPILLEGNYYFDKSEVNLEALNKKDQMYTCPIKKSTCDYYYLPEDDSKEVAWCYESITNPDFTNIESKIGLYAKLNKQTDITQAE
jgi:uncharacterized protein (DUF427 family)